MKDFERKVSLKDDNSVVSGGQPSRFHHLLCMFLSVQKRRAEAYASLKRYARVCGFVFKGFDEYMISGLEFAYQQLCSEITTEFNDCSKQVIKVESLFQNPDYSRVDLAQLLRAVQIQEKAKIAIATIQLLKKAGGSPI